MGGEPTTQVLAFKIKDLSNKRHLFKIDMNAQQFHLTGCCIACPGVANIVIVEGGPRAIKRYKKLMMRPLNGLRIRQRTTMKTIATMREKTLEHQSCRTTAY